MSARTAMRLAAVALAGGMAVPVLAGCYVDVGALQHRTKSYAVSGPVQALVVNAHVGGVHVTGGAPGTVLVTEHLRFRHTAPVTTHGTSARTLTMNSTCPARETCSISYDITVPRATDLRITDSVGTIRLRSLSGKVIAHTDVGNIDLSSVSGPIELTGHPDRSSAGPCRPPRHPARVSGPDRRHVLRPAGHGQRHGHRGHGGAARAGQRAVRRPRQHNGRQRPDRRHPQRGVAACHHGQGHDRLRHHRASALTGRRGTSRAPAQSPHPARSAGPPRPGLAGG